jgi:hypothetical protein
MNFGIDTGTGEVDAGTHLFAYDSTKVPIFMPSYLFTALHGIG